jgi:hypothetical protein
LRMLIKTSASLSSRVNSKRTTVIPYMKRLMNQTLTAKIAATTRVVTMISVSLILCSLLSMYVLYGLLGNLVNQDLI